MIKKILISLLLTTLLLAENNQTNELSFFDKKDGMVDLSNYLSQAYGFLPVPTLITEPAIGYGVGLGLIYLHDNFTGTKTASGRVIPASMSGVIAVGTQNGTKFGGAFYIVSWLEDNLRTTTFVGIPNVNIDTYTSNGNAISSNMKGTVAYQSVKTRVENTNLFLGVAYMYGSIDTELKFLVPVKENITSAAVEIIMDYDARNSTLSPTQGYLINAKASIFSEAVGSDIDFDKYSAYGYFYIPTTDKLNVNLKVVADTINGNEAPFYAYPSINLRGLPVMKVQGEYVLASELELSWKFKKRWDAIFFGGAGKAFGTNQFKINETNFSDAKYHFSKGIGFRYLIARKFGLKMGIDVASSEFDEAIYIQFGSAWTSF